MIHAQCIYMYTYTAHDTRTVYIHVQCIYMYMCTMVAGTPCTQLEWWMWWLQSHTKQFIFWHLWNWFVLLCFANVLVFMHAHLYLVEENILSVDSWHCKIFQNPLYSMDGITCMNTHTWKQNRAKSLNLDWFHALCTAASKTPFQLQVVTGANTIWEQSSSLETHSGCRTGPVGWW